MAWLQLQSWQRKTLHQLHLQEEQARMRASFMWLQCTVRARFFQLSGFVTDRSIVFSGKGIQHVFNEFLSMTPNFQNWEFFQRIRMSLQTRRARSATILLYNASETR
jgi:hypothetical protein